VSKARGKQRYFDATSVAGLDSRVWQEKGSANRTEGVLFSLQGEVYKAPGIQSIIVSSAAFSSAVYAIGAYHHHGTTELLVNTGDTIAVIRGNTVTTLVDDRTVPNGSYDAHRFVQVGDVMLIMNGRDGNLKYDGDKVTPLGIASVPPTPNPATDDNGELAETGGANTPYDTTAYWRSQSMKGASADQKFKYRLTWINDKGQESEPSVASESVIMDSAVWSATTHMFNILLTGLGGETPSDDIIARNLYRSTDGGGTWILLKRLSGTATETYWDHTEVGDEGLDLMSPEGTNVPPPVSKWAFPFRGRTYYGGNPDTPSLLYYSRGQGGKEAVEVSSFIDVSSFDGDILTGWALAQDFAVIFKKRSMHLLTHDKNEDPILTPITVGVGAVSDLSITTFEDKVYFLGPQGLFVFDGNKPEPLSRELNLQLQLLPPSGFKNAHAWTDPVDRRVLLSVVAGPTDASNEVWAIHVDSGAVSRLPDMPVYCATAYKDQTLVGYLYTDPADVHGVGIWGLQDQVGVSANYFDGRFETRWIYLDDPMADKSFYRLDVIYMQTGTYQLTVDYSLDWDDRTTVTVSTSAFILSDPDATVWGTGTWLAATNTWDSRRLRIARLDLSPGTGLAQVQGKAIRLGFETIRGATPWRLVGFYLHYSDHGDRSGDLDSLDTP
jgi:hypothetical protein